ncbi:hypothetical protein BV22DRAFT_1030054 [Leucogyrophana mollusca]|uniref:Uncharacterized protein n=1 Tax=Leucogyrophana mollusca TaxID=85980 RepID=A0ACB8BTZ9_9AGAM|nr:hypothetical protein BV22DRAFT_1030054 [Leucogyrophana mollusca]
MSHQEPSHRSAASPGNCKFMMVDITCGLPFEESSFDVVQMRIVPSLRDRSKILPEIWRVLRPDGFVLFLEPGEIFSGATQARTPAFIEEDRLLMLSPHIPSDPAGATNKSWSISNELADILRDAVGLSGERLFHDVEERKFAFPLGGWPEDPHEAQIGAMGPNMQISLLEGFRSMLIDNEILTEDGFKSLLDAVTAELNDFSLRMQVPYVYAWARKRH